MALPVPFTQPVPGDNGGFFTATAVKTGSLNCSTGPSRAIIALASGWGSSQPTITSLSIGGVAMTPSADTQQLSSGWRYKAFTLQGDALPAGIQTWSLAIEGNGAGVGLGKPFIQFLVLENCTAISAAVLNAYYNTACTINIPTSAGKRLFSLAVSDPVGPTPGPADGATLVYDGPGVSYRFFSMQEDVASGTTVAHNAVMSGTPVIGMIAGWSATGSADTTAPVITGPGGATGTTSAISVAEGSTAIHTFTADEAVTWSITPGLDAAKFAINASTGALTWVTAPNFEAPGSVSASNVYTVAVAASDLATSANITTQFVTVTVTNLNEAPTSTGTIPNLTGAIGSSIANLDISTFFADVDAGDTATYTKTGTAWPATVTLTGSIRGGTLPGTAGTTTGHTVTRTDAAGLTAVSPPFTITANSLGATAVTLSGPSTSSVGIASTNFTVGANGAITGSVVVTPSAGAGGGVFTPTTVTISSATPTATFTYTAATPGAKTITVSNNGALTNPASVAVTSSDVTVPVFVGSVSITPAASSAVAVTPVATDNVLVAAYDASLDGGVTWPFTSPNNTVLITGLTPSTPYTATFSVRDSSGNRSASLSQAFTTAAPSVGTFTSGTLRRKNNQLVSNATLTWLTFLRDDIGAHAVTKSNVAVGALGTFTIPDAALTAGVTYRAVWLESTGERGHGWAVAS